MVPDFVLLFEVKIIRSRGQSVVLAGGSIRRSTPPPLCNLTAHPTSKPRRELPPHVDRVTQG